MMAAPFCKEKPQGERSTARRVASVAPSGWVAQLCPCPKFGARWSFQISRFLKSAGNPGCRRNHPIGVLLCGGLLPLGLCCSPKRGERRTKPLKPPVRALHRLGIYTQHTTRHLGSCPNTSLRWPGPVRRRFHQAGHQRAFVVDGTSSRSRRCRLRLPPLALAPPRPATAE
jgi:hypothetical protein